VPPRELTMPKLSDSMADAVILRWLKSAGEDFTRGEGLIEVETDKATVIYEAEWDGTLDSILVQEGASVAVGEPIATLANGDGTGGSEAPHTHSQSERVSPPPAAMRPADAQSAADDSAPGRPVATPVARRTAVELGVSLHGLTGTGPGGRITVDDVTRAAAEAGTAPAPAHAAPRAAPGKGDVTVLEPTPTQATIARRMVESATTIPVFTVSADVDVSQIVASRRDIRDRGEDAPSVNDFVVRAAATALREFPRFNASYVDGRVELYSRINVGIAVATEDALLVPVVRDADHKSLSELAEETKRLAEAARARTLRPEDFHDGTFTVSNLGMFGVASFTAIIDPPQVAILAVGGARRAPVEESADTIAFRDLMTVTLSCDHRVVYGADGARFLSRLRELLERPLALAL
jgi:pyruvate dehydrogenase E2 component (dihydrolipoamide acetyltransferase)